MISKRFLLTFLFLSFSLNAFSWTLFGEKPTRELKPLESFYIEKLGGYNQKSFCRWTSISLSGNHPLFNPGSYYKCMDTVTGGKGIYGEKDRWKQEFESSLQRATVERGSDKKTDSEFVPKLKQALSQTTCNIMIQRDHYNKQMKNSVGERRVQFENAIEGLAQTDSLNKDWAKSAGISLPKENECIAPCGEQSLGEGMCCNSGKQYKQLEGLSRDIYGRCQCENGRLQSDIANTYVKCI